MSKATFPTDRRNAVPSRIHIVNRGRWRTQVDDLEQRRSTFVPAHLRESPADRARALGVRFAG